jgi:peptidoglycan/xylan/chitin deacetylase (PgdA/CDA1 family)
MDKAMSAIMRSIARAVPMRAIANRCAPIVTYHACFQQAPPEIPAFDNVAPERLYEEISHVKKTARLVPVDELASCRTFRGVGAVTFDDGYKSVIENALPVFEALDVPFTFFVNTFAFRPGHQFWRHKVMYLVNLGLGPECEKFLTSYHSIPGKSFYAALKDPSNNSRAVAQEIDRFLEHRGLQPRFPQYFLAPGDFVAHPLGWYGNHTHNHYVLASLPAAEQRYEIEATRDQLAQIPGIQLSGCVALPFGQGYQANGDTLPAVRELGYRTLLLARGGVNIAPTRSREGVLLLERFSFTKRPISLTLFKEYARTMGLKRTPGSPDGRIPPLG